MITVDRYSKDPSIQPDAVVVTFGMSMINMHGGFKSFTRFFEEEMSQEGSLWIHKQRGQPTHDIAFVYCIINGHVKYKLFYGGYTKEPVIIKRSNNKEVYATWPHIFLGGPLEEPPHRMPMKGFQGFRYSTKLF